MWTTKNRGRYDRSQLRYPSDLTDDEWALVAPLISPAKRGGNKRHVRLDRRDLVWINVTANPTAEWVARQITEAFPWDEAPHYLIRDRDRIYGSVVTRRLRAMGIRDKPTAPASPWQNGFAERLIGSIRRECVDHIIVLGETHLRRVLKSYANYYNSVRTHRSLNKDAPVSRPVQRTGVISSRAILGGLHHRYARQRALRVRRQDLDCHQQRLCPRRPVRCRPRRCRENLPTVTPCEPSSTKPRNAPGARSSAPMPTKATADTMRKIHAVSSSQKRGVFGAIKREGGTGAAALGEILWPAG